MGYVIGVRHTVGERSGVKRITVQNPNYIGGSTTSAQTFLVSTPAQDALLSDSSLLLWLRGDVGLSSSGGNVTAWVDQSGNGYTAQPTGTPGYVTNFANSLPGVSLAASKYFTVPGTSGWTFGNELSAFVAYKPSSSGTGQRSILSHFNTGYPHPGWEFGYGVTTAQKLHLWDGSLTWRQDLTTNSVAFDQVNISSVIKNATQTGFAMNGVAGSSSVRLRKS